MKRIVVIVTLVAAIVGAIAIRTVAEGRAALTDGNDALARGDSLGAIRAYEASARWYLPLAPHVDEAYTKLAGLTHSEDPAVVLAAWRAIRGAARASRSLWQPHASDLAGADKAIAELSARAPEAGRLTDPATSAPADAAARQAWHSGRLALDTRAGVFALVLAALGVLGWLGGGLLLARRGIDATGQLVRRPALASGAAIVLGLVCWAVGLYNA